jgi:HNH endonuclease
MPNLNVTLTQDKLQYYKQRVLKMIEDYSNPDPKTGCILWSGPLWDTIQGYGRISISDSCITYKNRVHRIVASLYLGYNLDSDFNTIVAHKCNNVACVNPKHLYITTRGQNVKDAFRDGLHVKGVSSHCKEGHLYKINSSGRSYCPVCQKRRDSIKNSLRIPGNSRFDSLEMEANHG